MITKIVVRWMFLASAFLLAGCSGGIPGFSSGSKDAGPTAFHVETSADDKALIYNLVGRWYPEDEIKRLSDRTLTPEQWCEREPTTIFVIPDKVEVRCAKGALNAAMISEAKLAKDGTITLIMRAKEDSALRSLTFDAKGPKATISGSPCFGGKPVAYARFPEYEIFSREILAGRRCAQLSAQIVEPEPGPTE